MAEPDFFTFLLRRAALTHPLDYLFVDLGSGKGRSLLLAALAGFQRVIGVELDRGLHSIACRNIDLFRSRCPSTEFTAILGDAMSFEFPPTPIVLFLNNPFDDVILEKVLASVERSLVGTPREFHLIYMHSNHAETVRSRSNWEQVDHGSFRSKRQFYAIFRWRKLAYAPERQEEISAPMN